MESFAFSTTSSLQSRFFVKSLQPPRSISAVRSPSIQIRRRRSSSFSALALHRSDHDVVVVGAGIIGLTIARHLLLNSDLSVAVTDARVPCSGATGAGQGYIWMVHKAPGTDTWDLAVRSKDLWEELAADVEREGYDPAEILGWKKTGSLLIGRSREEQAMLQERVKVLSEAGLRAQYLPSNLLHLEEPELEVGTEGGAAFVPDDCQLDAYKTVSFIEKVNSTYCLKGRYAEFFNDPAVCLLRSDKNGAVEAVQTSNHTLYARKAVVVATGAWTGSLLQNLVKPNSAPQLPVRPRKGHLLVLENFRNIRLNHGLMEVGYIDHQTTTTLSDINLEASESDQELSISMTATQDVMGNLVLGSSRQFCGFSREIDESIVECIWNRAGEFFPNLKSVSLDSSLNQQVRIGHRPYLPDGKPVIGPIPDTPNVFLAAGHEGSGLSLALATAEMVSDMILGNPTNVDPMPFSIHGRFSSNL
ncbi:Hydrogen cyanide synthase subunit HcnC [Carex littledalei]|uniref:FAD-dependent oxidoreductase domain-containing protein 1 n=1 Tax=Carex littledalei TaxID=544730 RepID=A0A833RB71_9POAL|nr:Hydrogen cyanide synthase subunit HcnC [Carex littledalei]